MPELPVAVDYTEVARAELLATNRFLPPRWSDLALLSQIEEVATWLESVNRRDTEPVPGDIVMARRSGSGARPLTYMSLRDRLAYRVAVDAALYGLPQARRSDSAYEQFVRSPLSEINAKYVLKTDVASFYHYIDHERLVDEVVSQTGDDLAASFAVELLQGATGRRFGLPQMTAPSDRLADVYIAPIERALLRYGFRTARFDDFRITCTNYNEALRALELIKRSALELGLTVNESKTTTPGLALYEQSLDEVHEAESVLFAETDGEDNAFDVEDGYDDDEEGDEELATPTLLAEGLGATDDEVDPSVDQATPEEAHPDPQQMKAAQLAIQLWANGDDSTRPWHKWTSRTWSVVLRKVLKVLTRGHAPGAVSHVTAILVREPHLAPQVCHYMCAMMYDREAVIGTLDEVCGQRVVSVWQSLWIAYCTGELGATNSTIVQREHIAWLRSQTSSEHHHLAAEATLALARRRLITQADILQVLSRTPSIHRPTVIMALAALGQTSTPAVVGDDYIERKQAEWAMRRWS